MPTARELLDQADALMRRNRKRGKDRYGDVPTLTDALDAGRDSSLAPTLVLPPVDAPAADAIALDSRSEPAPAEEPSTSAAALDPMPLDTLADVPVLTDVVLDWPPHAELRVPETGAERAPDALHDGVEIEWPGDTRREKAPDANIEEAAGVTELAGESPAREASHEAASGDIDRTADARPVSDEAFPASAAEAEAAAAELPPPAVLEREAEDVSGPMEPDVADAGHGDADAHSAAAARVPFLDDDFILEIPPPEQAQGAAAPASVVSAIAPSQLSAGSREWDALAEEIRMQVLQRLDIFTDTGLREQLGARVAPIVERASAQLIETINRDLGELVRGYVAEAIEREIASWRNQNPPKAE